MGTHRANGGDVVAEDGEHVEMGKKIPAVLSTERTYFGKFWRRKPVPPNLKGPLHYLTTEGSDFLYRLYHQI
jgi:hypothetical protein